MIPKCKQKNIYSTKEQVVGKWIDGKTLYRKVINFGVLPNATTKSVAHGLSNISFVKSEGMYSYDDSSLCSVIPNGNIDDPIRYWITNSSIVVSTLSDKRVFTKCYFILYYTKK